MSDTSNSVHFVDCQINEQGVAYLTLKRPDVHNAFDDHLIAELVRRLEALHASPPRVLVLGSIGKSFSAGADLGWMQRMAQYTEAENKQDALALARLMQLLDTLPCPSIARVQGAAYGGAVGLAACCDLVIASEKARFCLSEVKIGLSPAVISPYVIKAIGQRAMRRYALTAEVLDAVQAHTLGLVHEVVDSDQLDVRVDAFIQLLLANSPQGVRSTKALIHAIGYRPIDDSVQQKTTDLIASIRVSAEGQEGLSAFFQKRVPQWPDLHPIDRHSQEEHPYVP